MDGLVKHCHLIVGKVSSCPVESARYFYKAGEIDNGSGVGFKRKAKV